MSKITNSHQGSKLNILRYFWFAYLSKSLTKADLFIINCACKLEMDGVTDLFKKNELW